MTAPVLQIVLDSPLSLVGTYGEVVITVVHSELTRDALHAGVAANRELAATYPQKVGSLAIAAQGARIPSGELRTAASQAMAEARPHTRCAAQVLLGEGFWYSTLRSVLTAIEQLRPDDRPRRTFRSIEEAVPWLAAQLERDAEFCTGLSEAVQSLLERGSEQPGPSAD